jgi:hypothetical protein
MHGSGVSGDILFVMRLYFLATRSYATAIAHSAFRDQSRRRLPRPNENCHLRRRWANSIPAITMAAFAKDLNPAIDAQRRLIARWFCSIMLFRYLFVRTFTFLQHGCSRLSNHNARRLGTWPSRVTLRGTRGALVAPLRYHGRGEAGNRLSCHVCRPLDKDSATWL